MMPDLSPAIVIIRRFEGLRLRAYRDAVGVWTIGYGHTSYAGPPKVRPGMRITRAGAEEILRRDVEKFAHRVERAIGPRVMRGLDANRFGALVSFAYNVGIGNFRRSSVLRAVRDGRHGDVPRLLLRWTKAGGRHLRGLKRRRMAEGRLYATPAAGAHPPPRPRPRKPLPMAAARAAFLSLAALVAVFAWRHPLMNTLRAFFRRLKGWRTLAFALLVAALGVAEATDWASLLPSGPARGWYLFLIALGIAWLRVITDTPVGMAAGQGENGEPAHDH